MVVLELNFEKSWRGGERQTLYNMQGFRNAGINTALVCRKGTPMHTKAAAAGFATHAFSSVFGVIFFLASQGKKFDCIHAQTSHILTYCVLTKIFHGKKIIFTRRVNFTPKGFFTKLKYNRVDKIIAISQEIKNTVQLFCGRRDIEVISDIVVKENDVPIKNYELLAGIGINKKHIIGTIAALTEEKGPFIMIEAIKKLSATRNDFIFCHFGDGVLINEARKKIEENQLQNAYLLMGFKENVQDFFRHCEVFAISSVEEGLGSSVLDAFINKVPVVSTNAGGLKELLQNERGILCQTGDSEAIANGINTFLNNQEKKDACINNAYTYVNNHHSMEQITKQYISILAN